jgi:pimeloyl-ACP methyl ester carboxylesterase
MAWFEHNQNEICFDIRGAGPDLLFMHGLAADKNQALQILQGLSGYRLITLDMPGHGESHLCIDCQLKDQVSFSAYAELARALLVHLQIQSAIVGGISMGAGIALRLAISEPNMIRALLLVRPAWLDQPGRPHLSIVEDVGRWIADNGISEAKKRLNEHSVYTTALAQNPNCAASIMGIIKRPQAAESALVLLTMVADRPISRMSSLRKCSVPALVVGNNADPLHPAKIARELCSALFDGQYFHAPPRYLEPQEHKTAVVKRIQQFLIKNLPRSELT